MFSFCQTESVTETKKKRKKSSELECFATSKHLFSYNPFIVSVSSETVSYIVKEIKLCL